MRPRGHGIRPRRRSRRVERRHPSRCALRRVLDPERLERLARYVTRPVLAAGAVSIRDDGRVDVSSPLDWATGVGCHLQAGPRRQAGAGVKLGFSRGSGRLSLLEARRRGEPGSCPSSRRAGCPRG